MKKKHWTLSVDNETEFEEDNDVDETFESKEDVESVTQPKKKVSKKS